MARAPQVVLRPRWREVDSGTRRHVACMLLQSHWPEHSKANMQHCLTAVQANGDAAGGLAADLDVKEHLLGHGAVGGGHGAHHRQAGGGAHARALLAAQAGGAADTGHGLQLGGTLRHSGAAGHLAGAGDRAGDLCGRRAVGWSAVSRWQAAAAAAASPAGRGSHAMCADGRIRHPQPWQPHLEALHSGLVRGAGQGRRVWDGRLSDPARDWAVARQRLDRPMAAPREGGSAWRKCAPCPLRPAP